MPVCLQVTKHASIHKLYDMNGVYRSRMRTVLAVHGRSCPYGLSYDLSHDLVTGKITEDANRWKEMWGTESVGKGGAPRHSDHSNNQNMYT